MKHSMSLLFSCLGFVAISVVSCDDGSSSSESDALCMANICKNETTLSICENGSYRDEVCSQGLKCSVNACVPEQSETCTANVCKDETTLSICEKGSYRDEVCSQGMKCICPITVRVRSE